MAAARLRGVRVDGRQRPRLADVDVDVPETGVVAIVGKNGSGKSTLLDVILGRIRPGAGQVALRGADPAALDARERASRAAWLPQHPRIEQGLTAIEVVMASRYRFAEPRSRSAQQADAALASVGASAWRDAPMSALSGGEAQRVRVAALIAQEAPVWLLDEPANHLDVAATFDLVDRLRDAARDHAVVVVTHDLGLLSALPGDARVVGLVEGRVALDARLADDDVADGLGAVLGLRVAAVHVEGRRFVAAGAR